MRVKSRVIWITTIALTAVVTCGSLSVWLSWPHRDSTSVAEKKRPDTPIDAKPAPASVDPVSVDIEPAQFNENPGYVGHQVCSECHQERVGEFEQTRHYRACWTPSKGPMPSGFFDGAVASSARTADSFRLSVAGDDFFQTVIRKNSDSTLESDLEEQSKISLIYGSRGRADEIYFTWKGNQLFELPVAWLGPRKCAALQAFTKPEDAGDYTRPATTRCLECHNTWFAHAKGSENEYRPDSFILGVTCERCHGPGREHVNFHRARPGAFEPHAIVNPAALSRDRQMDICGQCHTNSIYRRTPLFSFVPGDRLEDHFRVLTKTHFDSDHVADQIKYLRESKCFQHNENLTCTTCHNPHVRTDASVVGEQACAGCHAPKDCRAHDQLPNAVRSSCVDCHMPRYNRAAVIFHVAEDSYLFPMRPRQHRIGIYATARDEVLLDWYAAQTIPNSQEKARMLRESLIASRLDEADSFLKEYRFIAAISSLRDALRFTSDQSVRAKLQEVIARRRFVDDQLFEAQKLINGRCYSQAIQTLHDVLEQQPTNAIAHAKLGTVYAVVGERQRSEKHLRLVSRYDPNNAAGANMLGWTAYLRGDFEEAVAAFRRADAIYPFASHIIYRLSLALLGIEHWRETEEQCRKLLQIDPNHAGGCQCLSHALRHQGKAEESLRYARRAIRLSDATNIDMLITLADAYLANEHKPEARQTLQQALEVASRRQPNLVPQLHARLNALKTSNNAGTGARQTAE